MNTKDELRKNLEDCELSFVCSRRDGKWDEAQEAAEAMMQLCRRLALLEIQTKAEQTGKIV